jgi:hypothetical protein
LVGTGVGVFVGTGVGVGVGLGVGLGVGVGVGVGVAVGTGVGAGLAVGGGVPMFGGGVGVPYPGGMYGFEAGELHAVSTAIAWYTGVAGIGVGMKIPAPDVSAVPENVSEMTEFNVPLQSTSDPTSGVRRKFWLAEVEVVLPIARRKYMGTCSVAPSEGWKCSSKIVGSIANPASPIEAYVLSLQSGEGVPRQKNGMRCGEVCVVSTVLIAPLPLIDCGPGSTHGGGVVATLMTARYIASMLYSLYGWLAAPITPA